MANDRAALIAEAVQTLARHVGIPDAVELVAKTFGVTPQTVRRNLRRAKLDAVLPAPEIHKHFTTMPMLEPAEPWTTLKGIAIGDTHDDPRLPKDRFRWLGALVRDTKADFVVQIGDFSTFDSLCRYIDNSSYEARSTPVFLQDVQSQAEALTEFDKGLGRFKPKLKHITFGNHDDRVESFSNRHPEIYGVLGGMVNDNFTRHGWTVSEYGKIIFVGGVGFVHVPFNAMGKPFGGKTAEHQIAAQSTFDVVFGHSHRNRLHTAEKIGDSNFVRVLNLGSALPYGHVEKYAKHSSTGWSYGAYELTLADNHIMEWNFHDMRELERKYG